MFYKGNVPWNKGLKVGSPKAEHWRKGMRIERCVRGHDTTSPDSRRPNGMCKACAKEWNEQYSSSPERKEKAKEYRNSRPEYVARQKALQSSPEGKAAQRKRQLRSLGWTPELFEKRLKEQGNVCAVGGHPFSKSNPPCADHEHINPPKPRGILCREHNSALGKFHDSDLELSLAIDYLKLWSLPKTEIAPIKPRCEV